MATSNDYIEFVMNSLSNIKADLYYKKMFGEYCVYANDKPIMLVCDNTVYIKILPCIEPFMSSAQIQPPYNGAQPRYILDIENEELTNKVVVLLEQNTPLPKPKKRKSK